MHRMKMKLCLIGLLCLLCSGLFVKNVFAANNTVEIYRTDYGAKTYKNGKKCASIQDADRYNIYYRMGPSHTGNHLYRHDGDRLLGYSDNDLVIVPTAGGSKTCPHPTDVSSPNIDYWLVIKENGKEHAHKIGEGLTAANDNQSGWDTLSVIFGDKNLIQYSNSYINDKTLTYNFDGDAIAEKEATYDKAFNDITFLIPGNGTCNNGVNFKNTGKNTYTITFVSDGAGGDNAGYFYGVDGAANFSGGKSCRYFANDEHTLKVKDGRTGTSDSLTIKDKTKKLIIELSVKNGKIKMTEKESEYTTGQIDDEYTQYGDLPIETTVTCANSGAANSLGWILCPVLKLLSDAAQTAYEGLLEPALKIEPQLFNPNENTDAVRNAWGIFQGVANTLFIILLLVVIFSQLTGVGIDNYGIKKILPKMILMAIMINLSYVICLICVDLSNILGNGLRAMFDGVNITIPTSMAVENGEFTIEGGKTMLVAAAVLAGAVLSIWAAVKNSGDGGSAILVALVMAALSIVVAIFFLFILLAARQAAVVVLTVLSPVAFACYMLPNTKKIFDRWLKIWWGLLLVYPIAGALMGGGNFVSKVLLAASGKSGFFAAFMAMIAGIVPIFFIPTVLKNSFSALGNLGAKISGMGKTVGNRLSGGAGRAIKNSRGYQERAQYNKEQQDLRRAKRTIDKLGSKDEKSLNGRQRRKLYNAQGTVLQNQDRLDNEERMAGMGFEAAQIAQKKKVEAAQLADYMTFINDKTRNGEDEAGLMQLYNDYLEKGNKAGAVAVARIAGRRKDTADSFLNKSLRGADLSKYNSDQRKIFASVAKEISTGENSGVYRSAAPLAFEFAAQYNRDPGNATNSYTDWVEHTDENGNYDNVKRALDNYVTNSQELVGIKNKTLGEINTYLSSGKVDKETTDRIRKLAGETIDNRGQTGVWDTTKEGNIYEMAGREIPSADETTSGEARENETFNIRQSDSPVNDVNEYLNYQTRVNGYGNTESPNKNTPPNRNAPPKNDGAS